MDSEKDVATIPRTFGIDRFYRRKNGACSARWVEKRGGGGIHLRGVINRANSEVAGAGEVSEHYFTLLE